MEYDWKRMSGTAAEALEFVQKGDFEKAEAIYREVITQAEECDHYQLSDFYHQLASVLARTSRMKEALNYHEQALSTSLRQTKNDNESSSVGISRYFLGEHLLKMNQHEKALSVVEPSIGKSDIGNCLLRVIEASALWRLNRKDDARDSAKLAIECAPNDEKKEMLERRFQDEVW